MDRKIELNNLTDADFQELMNAANAEVLKIAKGAQDKINELLGRFNVRCDLSLGYNVLSPSPTSTALTASEVEVPSSPPVKKNADERKKKKQRTDTPGYSFY